MAIIVTIQRFRSNESYKDPDNPSIYNYLKSAVYQNNTQSPFVLYVDHSIQGTSEDEDNPVTLVNDLETVPIKHYYGTASNNERGFYPLADIIRVILNDPGSGIYETIFNVINQKNSDSKETYVVTTTSDMYVQQTLWNVLTDPNHAIGNFKATVTIHDLATNESWVLQNTMGFDFVDVLNSIQDDNYLLSYSAVTLTLDIASDGTLQATVEGMPTNNKRIHFCFERCTQKVQYNLLPANTGTFILTGFDVEMTIQRKAGLETGVFVLTGNNLGLPGTLLAETGVFVLTGNDINFPYNTLVAETGVFILTGNDVTLTIGVPVYPVEYGALYNWYAATDARNISSGGWHVPTYPEWTTLSTYLGGSTYLGNILKETGIIYWQTEYSGVTNEAGFNGRGGGLRAGGSGVFGGLKSEGHLLSSFNYNATETGCQTLGVGTGNSIFAAFLKKSGYGLRLMKDATTLSNGQTGTYTGNDGKVYRTICIGTQEWLADNLLETKFRNGDWITGYDGGTYTPISDATWAALTTEAMCFYDNNEAYG